MSMPGDGSAAPYALDAQEGEALWFFGGLMTIKATSEQTGGSFALVEEVRPRGTPTPAGTEMLGPSPFDPSLLT